MATGTEISVTGTSTGTASRTPSTTTVTRRATPATAAGSQPVVCHPATSASSPTTRSGTSTRLRLALYTLATIAAMGAGLVRQAFAWSIIEPRPGAYDFDLPDRFVAAATQYGLDGRADRHGARRSFARATF